MVAVEVGGDDVGVRTVVQIATVDDCGIRWLWLCVKTVMVGDGGGSADWRLWWWLAVVMHGSGGGVEGRWRRW